MYCFFFPGDLKFAKPDLKEANQSGNTFQSYHKGYFSKEEASLLVVD